MNPPLNLVQSAAEAERLGDFNRARDLYRQAVESDPSSAQLWACLGRVCHALGQVEEAAGFYERAAVLRPDDPDLLSELGLLWMRQGRLVEAIALYQEVLQLRPDCVTAHNNLGLAFLSRHQTQEAKRCFEQALALRPDLAALSNNLGLALLNEGEPRRALKWFEEAVRREPTLADAHNNRGLALQTQGLADTAFSSFKQAVTVDPQHQGALTNLAGALKDQGNVREAIHCYRRVLELRPDDAPAQSNLLLAMQYSPDYGHDEILAEARNYALRHADPLGALVETPATREPSARVRVGYVSADFREHPVIHFLEPILAAHDHDRFEVFCYSDVAQPDAITTRLQAHADHWRSLVGLSDAHAAELIHQDRITILIDLAGHTAGNRLLCFARRPSPIQVSYLGYLGTTGLRAMDYYVTDEHADPTGVTECFYQEELVRVTQCALCYAPGSAPEPAAEPAAVRSGRITFGSLNNSAKLTDQVLALWSEVLLAVPDSRLVIAHGGSHIAEERIRAHLGAHRAPVEHLHVADPAANRRDYLELYRSIDIALDPFPYNGVTTTCDALWMGVPVISLAGVMNVSRQGVRFLRNLELDELLASSPEEYVRIASDLASDLARLARLHGGLRERMSRSPLVDSLRLTRELEAVHLDLCERKLGGRTYSGASPA